MLWDVIYRNNEKTLYVLILIVMMEFVCENCYWPQQHKFFSGKYRWWEP
jgi:hypothetical protein